MRSWAGSGKITQEQWVACLQSTDYDATAAEVGVCRETVMRIARGRAWKDGWRPKTLASDDETKSCEVCGKLIVRRFPNGRRRSPAMWKKKRTCSNSCNVSLMWREGVYASR